VSAEWTSYEVALRMRRWRQLPRGQRYQPASGPGAVNFPAGSGVQPQPKIVCLVNCWLLVRANIAKLKHKLLVRNFINYLQSSQEVEVSVTAPHQEGVRPNGRCDTRPSSIILDKCHENEAFSLMKCIR